MFTGLDNFRQIRSDLSMFARNADSLQMVKVATDGPNVLFKTLQILILGCGTEFVKDMITKLPSQACALRAKCLLRLLRFSSSNALSSLRMPRGHPARMKVSSAKPFLFETAVAGIVASLWLNTGLLKDRWLASLKVAWAIDRDLVQPVSP